MNNHFHICNSVPTDEEPLNLFDDHEIDVFLYSIYVGLITTRSLSMSVYKKTAEKLMEGVLKGFEKSLIEIEYGTADDIMLKSLRENVYVFSAAKDYQQTKLISSLLSKDGGFRSYAEFKELAKKEFTKFNENYLRAEYNSAIAQARAARLWQTIEADKGIYPQLQYNTAGDQRVRKEHAALNKIVRPVDDHFWDMYYPPNGWSCRCTVLQVGGQKNTDLSKKAEPTKKEVPEIFRFNAGKSKIIFSPAHPYFEIAKQDKDFAKQNFNLPLP